MLHTNKILGVVLKYSIYKDPCYFREKVQVTLSLSLKNKYDKILSRARETYSQLYNSRLKKFLRGKL